MAVKRTVEFNFKSNASTLVTQMDQIESKSKKISKNLKDVGKSIAGVGKKMTVGLTLPIVAAIGASAKLASDMEETISKIDVIFGDSATEIKEWSKTSLKSMGLAQQSALDTLALFGDMGTGMGLTADDAGNMGKDLVQLSADLASFKNIRQDVAETALKGIFTGETESLKGLGIVMTQANLQAFALSKGLDSNIKDMSEAEKVNLRFAFVMDRTTKAQGDFERTGGAAANQTRMFQESLKEIGVQMGTIILPMVTKVITKLNEWLLAFQGLDTGTKTTILVILGIVAVLGPLVAIIGTLISVIGGISAAFTFLAANPILLVIAAIILIVILLIKNFDKVKAVIKILAKFFVASFKVVGKILGAIFKGIGNMFIGLINLVISGLNLLIKGFLAPFNAIIKGLNLVPGVNIPTLKVAIPKIPKLAIGTDRVKRDGLANIHKGETIVPASVAKGGFTGNMNKNFQLNKSNKSNINITLEQTPINLNINNRTIANAILPELTRQIRVSGGGI